MIGMTPEQFWKEDPHLFFNYLEAYSRKKKEEYEVEMNKMNISAWVQGVYMCAALKAHPMFGKGKPYPEKPIDLNKSQEESSPEQEEDMRQKQAIVQMMEFEKYARLYNKTYFAQEEGK